MAYKMVNPKNTFCPPDEPETCHHNPDLILLRDAAADEREAIALYLQAGTEICCCELFLDAAEDEMQHYIEIMQQISRLDPVQSEALRDEGLDILTMRRALPNKLKAVKTETDDIAITPPSKKEIPCINYLTKALIGEFHAINKYQTYMCEACDPPVKALFCELMNDEKEHVAEFTAALFKITHEPLPKESD